MGVEINSSAWNEATHSYDVSANAGTLKFRSRFLVSAVGALNHPLTPQFARREVFRGQTMHTAEWDERIVLEGKRVGVIGTAASAI